MDVVLKNTHSHSHHHPHHLVNGLRGSVAPGSNMGSDSASNTSANIITEHKVRSSHGALTSHESNSKAVSSKAIMQQQQQQLPSRDVSGAKDMPLDEQEYLYSWQLSWKELIAHSVIYLDGSSSPTTMVGRDKRRTHIKMNCFKFHAKVVDFFNADEVTVIITRRQYDKSQNYPRNDIFHHASRMRIWSFEKAVKFFNNLNRTFDLSAETMHRLRKNHSFSWETLKENEVKRFKAHERNLKAKRRSEVSNVDESNIRGEEDDDKEEEEDNEGIEEDEDVEDRGNEKGDGSTNDTQYDEGHRGNNVNHRKVSGGLQRESTNRISLINSLKKTSHNVPKTSTPQNQQTINYQKQVYQILNYQKAAPHISNSHQYQVPTIRRNMNFKPVLQSNYQRQPPNAFKTSDKLATLLTKEKLHGPTDRDPNVRPHNYYMFENPFVFLYDLRQAYRPLITKEWLTKNYPNLSIEAPWARFYPTVDGRCLFAPDTIDLDNPVIVKKRKQMFDARKEYRDQLRQICALEKPTKNSTAASTSATNLDAGSMEDHELEHKYHLDEYNNHNSVASTHKSLHALPPSNTHTANTRRTDMAVPNNNSILLNNERKRSFNEMKASGITQSNNSQSAASQSVSTGRFYKMNNGLGPTLSHVASKEFKSLKKRMLEKDEVPSRHAAAKTNINGEKKTSKLSHTQAAVTVTNDNKENVDPSLLPKKTPLDTNTNTNTNFLHKFKKPEPVNKAYDHKHTTTHPKEHVKEAKQGEEAHAVTAATAAADEIKFGYCENCRIRYQSFNEHIRTAKHRDFAKDDRNFENIDSFIRELHSFIGLALDE